MSCVQYALCNSSISRNLMTCKSCDSMCNHVIHLVTSKSCDSSSFFRQWMEALGGASSIEVQKVNTMDEIRISDSDLKRRWRSLEQDLTEVSYLVKKGAWNQSCSIFLMT